MAKNCIFCGAHIESKRGNRMYCASCRKESMVKSKRQYYQEHLAAYRLKMLYEKTKNLEGNPVHVVIREIQNMYMGAWG